MPFRVSVYLNLRGEDPPLILLQTYATEAGAEAAGRDVVRQLAERDVEAAYAVFEHAAHLASAAHPMPEQRRH